MVLNAIKNKPFLTPWTYMYLEETSPRFVKLYGSCTYPVKYNKVGLQNSIMSPTVHAGETSCKFTIRVVCFWSFTAHKILGTSQLSFDHVTEYILKFQGVFFTAVWAVRQSSCVNSATEISSWCWLDYEARAATKISNKIYSYQLKLFGLPIRFRFI